MKYVALLVVLVGCGSKSADSGDSPSDAESSSGAQPRCGGAPGNCEMFSPCEGLCGDVASAFDAEGCLRAACASDADCDAGERCFVGADFDACLTSPVSCTDDPVSMSCSCTPGPECGSSGSCVPDHIYPSFDAGPDGVAVIEQGCGPDDGVLTILRIYPPGTVVDCAAPPTDVDTALELVFAESALDGAYEFSAMMANGSGTFTDINGDGEVRAASLTVADISAPTTDGGYTYVLYDGGGISQYGGAFTDALSCQLAGPCG